MTKLVECSQVQTERRQPFWHPPGLSFIRTLPIFELGSVFDETNPYVKFGKKLGKKS